MEDRPDAPDADLTPEERFSEVARILAGGLLRLKPRPGSALVADIGHVPPEGNPSDSRQKALELRADLRTHVPSG